MNHPSIRYHPFLRAGALFSLLAAGCTCATAHPEPAVDFSGTAMAACDVNDGPASQIVLDAAKPSGGRLHILVHDATPPSLQGSFALSDAGYARASASLSRCEGRTDTGCSRATEGVLTVEGRSAGTIQGHLRFRIGAGPWREGSFRAVIKPPPQPLLCG